MNRRLMIAALAATPLAAMAQDDVIDTFAAWQADPFRTFTSEEVSVEDMRWQLRGLFVFGQAPNEPAFVEQMQLIDARRAELIERDVIVVTDTDPSNPSELRRQFRPRAFMMVLIGKDGQIKLRKPAPWDVRELSRAIDKMPMRQQEIENRRGTGG